jgi:hypothetical protein
MIYLPLLASTFTVKEIILIMKEAKKGTKYHGKKKI